MLTSLDFSEALEVCWCSVKIVQEKKQNNSESARADVKQI